MGQNTGILNREENVQKNAIRIARVTECLQVETRKNEGYTGKVSLLLCFLPELKFWQTSDKWLKFLID